MSLGLYLHFPFCHNRCLYCDFYKELHDPALESRFYEALRIETELAAVQSGTSDHEVATIYVGGGTPSLTSLELFGTWLRQVKSVFHVSPQVEFSFENNPEFVIPELLAGLKDLGVNRPTFGVQSFNPRLLHLLDRRHSPDDCHRAIYLANTLAFENYGVDLLFGIPHQTSKLLSADLDQLVDLDPPHISFYQLTVEDGTPLQEDVRVGRLTVPGDELTTAHYRAVTETLRDAGYERYEVSSFAKPGCECKHNLRYWTGDDYLGLGPSAHSFIQGRRFANRRSVTDYIDSLARGRRPLVVDESGTEQRMLETIMLSLRTARGINRRRFRQRFGHSLEERLDRTQYDMFVESGHLIPDRGSLRLSDDGILVADEITRRLIR
ncbi:MAG TPA: radical SAM family heme chaperone HemW [Acidobacteriota bacterium]|nr:radical SAM family heme chaperone HemW [Acidobacteriota bacterium]